MKPNWIGRIDKGIRFSFYAIFFLVPLVMFPTTYELFEFNKMWTVFGISLVIAFLWTSKMILSGRIILRRTPFDIPIVLFALSQIISTFFSIDPHVSFWGYYSRFNGGLLSILTYVFLYYAFASNCTTRGVTRLGDPRQARSDKRALGGGEERQDPEEVASHKLLTTSLISGIIVALWGFPSHFGYDPTCLVFRGTLNVACWTASFQPTVRMFSTLGQPNWLAAYLSVLIPITIAMLLKNSKIQYPSIKEKLNSKIKNYNFFGFWNLVLGSSVFLFYIDLLWTHSQSGFVGFWVGMAAFIILVLSREIGQTGTIWPRAFSQTSKIILGITVVFLAINFFQGTPIEKLNRFTLQSLSKSSATPPQKKAQETTPALPALESSITRSDKIRLIVWRGALEIWRQNPLFGTGPDTFAYAYYKVRPAEHNLTSEWDYLYNKAHNEYLNYLATSGAFGLGTYLLLIGWFLFRGVKWENQKRSSPLTSRPTSRLSLLAISLIASYISILVSNFFGFSVVILNLFLFAIPIFFLDLTDQEDSEHVDLSKQTHYDTHPTKVTAIVIVGLVALYFEIILVSMWRADIAYAYGNNLDKAGEYAQATSYLVNAVRTRPGEDLFKDELSVNLSTLAVAYKEQNASTQAAQLAGEAKALSLQVVTNHPHNVVYFKSRTRVLFALSELDKQYLKEAVSSIETAHALAPTDAKIVYNMALLYDQAGDREKALKALDEATRLRPNYRDAYYALALFYSQMTKDEKEANLKESYRQKAIDALEYILKNITPSDKPARELLNSLK